MFYCKTNTPREYKFLTIAYPNSPLEPLERLRDVKFCDGYEIECDLVQLVDGSTYMQRDSIFMYENKYRVPPSARTVRGTPKSTGVSKEEYIKIQQRTAHRRISQFWVDGEIDPSLFFVTDDILHSACVKRSEITPSKMRLQLENELLRAAEQFKAAIYFYLDVCPTRVSQQEKDELAEEYREFVVRNGSKYDHIFGGLVEYCRVRHSLYTVDSTHTALSLEDLLDSLNCDPDEFANHVGTAITDSFIRGDELIVKPYENYDHLYWDFLSKTPQHYFVRIVKYQLDTGLVPFL